MIFELCLLTCALHFGSKLFAQKNDKMSLTIEPNEPNIKTQQYVVKELTEITDNQREYENEIDEGFTLSVMSTGLAAAGSLFLPPFSILSLFGIIYPCKTIFNKAYDATFNEKK
ncbi:MAG: hypothetical protein OMM_06943 [Candidatus Magnetoglobus multicellularis str. Araruama]|uniref:Uncharacterized protein n=1 Tax=Candidatus Magnetoglobus multicellularis str. Araruama TaxID=890399 RepID=A0A1V1PF68_9BACT|nr:MAG: hypothetical protein OMM_06943 [Candidatus Magnetoglobus multicellularis str. Araruama]